VGDQRHAQGPEKTTPASVVITGLAQWPEDRIFLRPSGQVWLGIGGGKSSWPTTRYDAPVILGSFAGGLVEAPPGQEEGGFEPPIAIFDRGDNRTTNDQNGEQKER